MRVAHMPTAAEADAASRRVIERNNERPGVQLTNRPKRSRSAGPFQSFRLFTNGQDIRVRVNGPEASVIGRFMSAVSEFLRTNKIPPAFASSKA